MSTQPVSNSLFQELPSFYQSRSADVKQLGRALQAGNMMKAEQVYSALVALGQNGPVSNSEAFASSGRANAFEAVGQALQSGDLAGAQAAFAKLQQAPSQRQGDLLNAAFVVTITSTQNQPVEQDKSGFRHQRKLDLDQLGTALQSADAAAVQKAYPTCREIVGIGFEQRCEEQQGESTSVDSRFHLKDLFTGKRINGALFARRSPFCLLPTKI